MKLAMSRWVSLALLGAGVLFTQAISADNSAIEQGIGRRRKVRAGAADGDTPERKLLITNSNKEETKKENNALQLGRGRLNFEAEEESTKTESSLQLEEDLFERLMLTYEHFSYSIYPLPTATPSQAPTDTPVPPPTIRPTTQTPTDAPSKMPVKEPTRPPTTVAPKPFPTPNPTPEPTPDPTQFPSNRPTAMLTDIPTTDAPTMTPTIVPSLTPTDIPTTLTPTIVPTRTPTEAPTPTPSQTPTSDPTTQAPTSDPTVGLTDPPATVPTGPPLENPTFSPTGSPTQTPSLSPTLATPLPTATPTITPTTTPTTTPTALPTTTPTTTPTTAPSVLPTTDSPSAFPTESAAPTPGCTVEVEIICVWAADGVTDCRDIPVPGACSAYNIDVSNVANAVPLSSISMLFDYKPCSASLTLQEQPEVFSCVDLGLASTLTDLAAQITCVDDESNVLVDGTFGLGEYILLEGQNDNGDLGDVVWCKISEVTSGALGLLQEMNITTSVLGNFYLTDRYGSFVVESCDAQRCLEPVLYSYNITNTQSEPRQITELVRLRDGDIVSFLPLDNILQEPGESTLITEEAGINLCFDAMVNTTVMIESSSPDGPTCLGSDVYSILVEVECRIFMEIDCKTEDGDSCASIGAPSATCSEDGNPIQSLRLRYRNLTCEASESSNSQGDAATCRDFTMPVDRVEVACTSVGDGSVTTIIESGGDDIGEGETIMLSSDSSNLPSSVLCEMRSSLNPSVIYQVVSFDASGSAELNLRDQFGSLQVVACTTESASVDCQATVSLEYIVQNIGTNDVDVIDLTRTLGEETVQLLDLLPDTVLASGETTQATESVVVDLCQAEETCISSLVQSSGTNSLVCEDDDEICFGGTPSPVPTTTTPTGILTAAPTGSSGLPGTPSPNTELPTAPGTPSPNTEPPTASFAPSLFSTVAESPTQAPSSSGLPVTPSPSTEPPTAPGTPLPNTEPPTASIAPSLFSTVAESPTQAPSFIPDTPSPTSECILDVQTECTPPPGSENCEEIRTDPVLCQQRPESITLLFGGGGCQNSFNVQSDPLFQCEDYGGGPSTTWGDPSYVVITDIRGAGIVFFRGWVDIGDLILLASPEGGTLEADQNITIYGSNKTGPETILQTVTFHSSCSNNPAGDSLFLKDQFGAMQVVGFSNVDQGEISCFTSAAFEASVTVDSSVGVQPITLTSVVSRFSSVPGGDEGLVNFTSDVAGEQLTSEGDPLDVNLTLALNLTTRRTYNVFTTVTGTTTDGRECRGSDLFQFAAGQPPPPLFPTIAPTQRPSHSLQPSPDPQTTRCELDAVVQCLVKKGGSNSCEGLQNPSEVICTGNMTPSSLSFQYTGDRCPVNPQNFQCADTDLNMAAAREAVFVEVVEGERVIASGSVRLNDFITLLGDYGEQTVITLYTLENEQQGQPLQILNIPTACDPEDDLTLLNEYGALELTGFTNAASGEQGIEAQIELIYAVENSGFQLTTVTSALVIDAFDGGPIEVVDAPFDLEAGVVTILYRSEQVLNLRLKEQLGRIDTFFLSVEGSAVSNDLECTDTAQLVF